MKTVYVNKDGIICACTVEVPKEPKQKAHCGGTHACTCAGLAFEDGANRDVVDWFDDNCPYRYAAALLRIKESAVPFEDQEAAYGILYTWNSPAVGGVYKPTPDTFYQIDCDWEIVEIMNHRSSPTAASVPLYKVARLKVPAPTVATDNSGDEETYDCIHCNGTGQHSKPGLVQLVSPVEEEQYAEVFKKLGAYIVSEVAITKNQLEVFKKTKSRDMVSRCDSAIRIYEKLSDFLAKELPRKS